jgi:PAS domain S-box-containing protein
MIRSGASVLTWAIICLANGRLEKLLVYKISHPALRYPLAILAALVALYLRYLLTPFFGDQNPYHTLWLAVVFSAWYCGVGPAIVTTLLGAVGVLHWFIPDHSWNHLNRPDLSGLLGFLILSGVIIALGGSSRRAFTTQSRLAAIVGSSGDAIISKDLDGIITSWNGGAQRLFGWTEAEAIGKPVTILIPPELLHEEREILSRLRAGQRIEHSETVRVSKSGKRLNVSLTVSPIRDSAGRVIGASKISRDISERIEAEAKLKAAHDELEERVRERTAELREKNSELTNQATLVRELSARLMKSQDEARRRVARELHDSVGQTLTVLGMNLSVVAAEKGKLSQAAAKSVDESANLIDEISRGIRTISHLLHPPLLDEVGLSSALKWYVDGFSERSKIHVDLDMPENFERLTDEQEISIFRIVQECLTNIHRHSESANAAIRLSQEDGNIRLEVRDDGKGMPAEKLALLNSPGAAGVGFRGMRERARQLGGDLLVSSSDAGTVVTVTLRRAARSAQSAGGP